MFRLIWVVFLMGCITSAISDDAGDGDGDGIENYEDNCIRVKNADQRDLNQNQVGDACDLEWEKYLFDRCGNLDVCCGDGILHDGEQCDDGNEIDGDKCMNSCQRNLHLAPNRSILGEWLSALAIVALAMLKCSWMKALNKSKKPLVLSIL